MHSCTQYHVILDSVAMALDYMMLHLAQFFREHTTLSPPSIQSAVSGVALFPCRTLSSSSQCARLFSILSTRGWNCASTPAKSCEEDRWYIHLVFFLFYLNHLSLNKKRPIFYKRQFEMHFKMKIVICLFDFFPEFVPEVPSSQQWYRY